MPGGPAGLDKSRARAYCACSKCGWGGLDISSHISLSLGEGPIDCNIVSKGC